MRCRLAWAGWLSVLGSRWGYLPHALAACEAPSRDKIPDIKICVKILRVIRIKLDNIESRYVTQRSDIARRGRVESKHEAGSKQRFRERRILLPAYQCLMEY